MRKSGRVFRQALLSAGLRVEEHGVDELYAESELGGGVTTSAHGTLNLDTASMGVVYLPMVTRKAGITPFKVSAGKDQ